MDLRLPDIFAPALTEYDNYRYLVTHSGRAGGKSTSIAYLIILKALESKKRILCVRQTMLSINQSVHQLLTECIQALELESQFDIQRNKIICNNGSEIFYSGLSDSKQIRSFQNINIVWLEEADTVTEEAWTLLLPTVLRVLDCKIMISFNPNSVDDPVYKRFILNPPPKTLKIEMNYYDNPFLCQAIIEDAERMRDADLDMYNWVYLGKLREVGCDTIFRKVLQMRMNPSLEAGWDGPYYGIDFSNGGSDPFAFVKCWISPQNELYICDEIYDNTLTIDNISARLDTIENIREYTIRCDSSLPLMVSHLRREGFKTIGAIKKPGSVETGIHYLKAFSRIIISPTCINAFAEFKNYKWKRNKAGDILPEPIDVMNHSIDAVRYALEPLITGSLAAQKRKLLERPVANEAGLSGGAALREVW